MEKRRNHHTRVIVKEDNNKLRDKYRMDEQPWQVFQAIIMLTEKQKKYKTSTPAEHNFFFFWGLG